VAPRTLIPLTSLLIGAALCLPSVSCTEAGLAFPNMGPALKILYVRLPSMVTTENPSGHTGGRVLAAPVQVAAQTAMNRRR